MDLISVKREYRNRKNIAIAISVLIVIIVFVWLGLKINSNTKNDINNSRSGTRGTKKTRRS